MTRREGFGPEIVGRSIDSPFNDFELSRASSGVSTEVYRMEKGMEVYYLRIGNKETTMWAEAEAHRLCREKGAKVPEVIYFEEKNLGLQRSLMITTDVPGKSAGEADYSPTTTNEIVREAGRNIALINSIPMDKMGWIDDSEGTKNLRGIGTNYGDFILEGIEDKVERLTNQYRLFDSELATRVLKYVDNKSRVLMEYKQGYLAHGDFNLSHIFADNGVFSGIIDFGDIRSASPYHDLVHFYIYERPFFPALVEGYTKVRDLETDYMERIKVEAVVMAIGKLDWIGKKRINKLTNIRKDFLMVREIVENE